MLIDWISQYDKRDDPCSEAAPGKLYKNYLGKKSRVTRNGRRASSGFQEGGEHRQPPANEVTDRQGAHADLLLFNPHPVPGIQVPWLAQAAQGANRRGHGP